MRLALIELLIAGLAIAGERDAVLSAVKKALPLLQKTGPVFWERSGCIGCHHHSLPAMAVAIARERGFAVDETIARSVLKFTNEYIESRRDRILQGLAIPGGEDTIAYILFGLAVENAPATEATDALAIFLKTRQAADGRWFMRSDRPPLEISDVTNTALALRAIQVYAPPSKRAAYEKSIARAAAWLDKVEPQYNEDHVMKVLGLKWAKAPGGDVAAAAKKLLSMQRADGGWSQLRTLESDAYATGQALVALYEAGANTQDPPYKRGASFLVKTQLADGSWLVKSRSNAFQPYFESGFPHGHDQWISAAGSSWAAAALALTEPRVKSRSGGSSGE
jgi:hypothetical protein